MSTTLKSLAVFLGMLCLHSNQASASNPHQFIDLQAQEMVSIIRNNQELYYKDPELFKNKINMVFELMVDFRRVGASVMGKKYYHEFGPIFMGDKYCQEFGPKFVTCLQLVGTWVKNMFRNLVPNL